MNSQIGWRSIGAAAVAVLGFALTACGDGGEDEPTAAPTAVASPTETVSPTPTPTPTVPSSDDPFVGVIGDFSVRPDVEPKPACESPDLEFGADPDSELEFPRPEGTQQEWWIFRCDNGMVNMLALMFEQSGFTLQGITRGYFVDEQMPVPVTAPRDRLVVTEIAGFPALIELTGDPATTAPYGLITVIERMPTEDEPGIFWRALHRQAPDEGSALLESVIESQVGRLATQ